MTKLYLNRKDEKYFLVACKEVQSKKEPTWQNQIEFE